MKWLRNNSLWIIAVGLTLSSSSIDGAYMARWMRGAAWLGYVLNTVSDIAGMVLTYWYGRLQQDRSTRKRSLARLLLVAEGVAVLYSWFFSWRQLLIVLPAVEGDNTRWVAPIAAGFIPLLLAFIGYAQALLAGRIEAQQVTQQEHQAAHVISISDAKRETSVAVCEHCGAEFGSKQALSAHMRFCKAYATHKVTQGVDE